MPQIRMTTFTWGALVTLVATLIGCDRTAVERDTRPAFVLDPSKPFVIEFGRGGGQHGLDIVRVDETGIVQLSRVEMRPNAESTSLKLSCADVATLVRLVESNQLTGLGRMYSDPQVADGTQWVLWIEQAPSQKAIYFSNSFPDQIKAFAEGLDVLLQNAGLSNAKWSQLPAQQADAQQTAMWSRITPTR